MYGSQEKKLGQKVNVKFFRVYTYLWGTFNLGFKPEYIFGQGPTKKELINLQTRVQGN